MKKFLLKNICDYIKGKHTVLFWSGGYDSTFLYSLFIENKLYNITDLSIVVIRCPQEIYNEPRIKQTLEFLSGLPVRVYCREPQESLNSDIEFSKACSVCKRIRRSAISQIISEIELNATDGKEIVLLTGHNLDDLASYYLENVAYSLGENAEKYRERFIESVNKVFPVFDYSDRIKIFRPLTALSTSKMLEIFSDNEYSGLTLCDKKCRWLKQRKRLLQEYLSGINVQMNYDLIVKKFNAEFVMPTMEEFRSLPVVTYLM